MSRYTPVFRNQTGFEPVEVENMAIAFGQVCELLKISNADTELREAIAASIIRLARDGIDDPIGLRDLFLAGIPPFSMATCAKKERAQLTLARQAG